MDLIYTTLLNYLLIFDCFGCSGRFVLFMEMDFKV